MKPAQLELILCLVFACAPGDAAPAEVVSQVDLRKCRHDVCEYYVVLCARKSGSIGMGHAFVVWIERDPTWGTTNSAGYGFYPGLDHAMLRLMDGKGKLVDESTKPASMDSELLTHRLVLRVDADSFRNAWKMKEHWAQAGYDYRVFGRNCLHFTYAVGCAAGLAAPKPKSNDHPSRYFDRLVTRRPPAERRQAYRSPSRRPRNVVGRVSNRSTRRP